MEEKKVKLSTVIIFLLLIVIIAGGMYIYVLRTRNIEISNRLSKEQNKSAENSNNQIEEINKILMKEFGKTVDDFLEEINDSLGTHDNTKEKFLSTMAALTSLNKLIK